MLLYHYTSTIPETVEARDQKKSKGRKPIGFWVSDCDAGDGWREWCLSEEWGLAGLVNRLFVTVDISKILHLKSAAEIDDFTVEFHMNDRPYDCSLINWAALAEQYSGILISPYQWDRRLDGDASDWYYGWDCASGCVWDPAAITSMEVDKNWSQKAA